MAKFDKEDKIKWEELAPSLQDIIRKCQVPVGTIMSWMDNGTPGNGTWLLCNGQSIDQTKYPELAAMFGSYVPDLRGVFLRGEGSVNHSQNNGIGVGNTNTTYSSGALNDIQGDATRNIEGILGQLQWGENNDYATEGYYGRSSNVFWFDFVQHGSINIPPGGMASYPRTYGGFVEDKFIMSNGFGNGWDAALTKYKYSLSGDPTSGYSLQETEEHPPLMFSSMTQDLHFTLGMAVPTDNEIRPVNKATHFYIKALGYVEEYEKTHKYI